MVIVGVHRAEPSTLVHAHRLLLVGSHSKFSSLALVAGYPTDKYT